MLRVECRDEFAQQNIYRLALRIGQDASFSIGCWTEETLLRWGLVKHFLGWLFLIIPRYWMVTNCSTDQLLFERNLIIFDAFVHSVVGSTWTLLRQPVALTWRWSDPEDWWISDNLLQQLSGEARTSVSFNHLEMIYGSLASRGVSVKSWGIIKHRHWFINFLNKES